jgi:predicted nucleic acid-binding protein
VNVVIEIPDDVARQLQERSGELTRAVLEAVAVQAYRSGALTTGLSRLHDGEREAILLAEAVSADLILWDDRSARQIAMQRGRRISGVFGVVVEAAPEVLSTFPVRSQAFKRLTFGIHRRC